MTKIKPEFMINGLLNSQRVLVEKKYQLPKQRGFIEDKWLISYMFQCRLPKDVAFRYWSEIYLSCNDFTNEEDALHKFNTYWGVTIPFFEGNPIVFYWDEIADINNSEMLPWIKEFILVLLGYFKFMGWKKQRVDLIPVGQLIAMTRAKQRREQNDEKMYSIPEEKGLVKINVDSESISLPFMKNEGKIALELKTTVDLPLAFGLLRNEKHCEQCGKVFQYNEKSQTNLCKACWKIFERKRINIAVKSLKH